MMNRGFRRALVAMTCATAMLHIATTAHAFDDEANDAHEQRLAKASRDPIDNESATDQERWIGRVGIGFYGLHAIPLPQADANLIDPSDPNSPFQLNLHDLSRTVTAPAVGIRYWFNRDIGLDAAVGFWTYGGSDKSTDPNGTRESELESRTAFLLHAGLPIVLGGGKHVSVQLTPGVSLGFAGGKWKPAATGGNLPPSVDESGFLFQIGTRIGAEVFFGFIGMPELALEGSLGVYLQTQSGTASAGNTEMTRSETMLATNNFNSPWDFFTSSLAARYYF